METQSNELSELWRDPRNWRLYLFYVCREDPRLLVPKRFRVTGWTLNFAHPEAVLLFAALLAVILVPLAVVEVSGNSATPWVRLVTIAISILVLLILTWWASKLRVK